MSACMRSTVAFDESTADCAAMTSVLAVDMAASEAATFALALLTAAMELYIVDRYVSTSCLLMAPTFFFAISSARARFF